MNIIAEQPYNHSVEDLVSYYFNAEAAKQKLTDMGNRAVDILLSERGESKGKIEFTYEAQASSNVPSALKALSSEWTAVKQTELWHSDGDTWTCEYDVELDGVPVTLKGSIHVVPSEQGCVSHMSLDINCGIPLLGKMVEEFIAKDSKAQMDGEYAYIQAALAAK